MATIDYTLTDAWTQVSTTACLVQKKGVGDVAVHIGETEPAENAGYHQLTNLEPHITVRVQSPVWARGLTDNAVVAVSEGV